MALLRPARVVEDVSVVAVAARDKARAAAFAGKFDIDRVYGSYEDVLADADVDAVYNPLPNSHHKRWTIAALRAGKHVLVEKPIAANADDARDMADAARDCGKVLMEAFHWRYHPLTRRVLDELPRLGRLTRVQASMCVPFLKTQDIRFDYDLAGGALMDTGCYAVNMARTFAGVAGADDDLVVDDVAALLTRRDRRVDRALTARLHKRDGCVVVVSCSLLSSTLFAMRAQIEGERGRIDVWNPVAPQFGHLLRMTIDGPSRKTTSMTTMVRGKSSYAHQLEAFRDAIVDGAAFPSSADDGVANMAVIDALYAKAGLPRRQSV